MDGSLMQCDTPPTLASRNSSSLNARYYNELPPQLLEQLAACNEKRCRKPFLELKRLIDFGILDRKKHWRLFRKAVRIARQNNPTKEEIAILDAIDRIFYHGWSVPRISLGKGTILFLTITIFLESGYLFILNTSIPSLLAALSYVILTFLCIVFTHCIEHYFIGRLFGIQFFDYFFFHPSFRKVNDLRGILRIVGWKVPTIGIKYQLDSFLRAKKWQRTLMLAIPHFMSSAWLITNYNFLLLHYSLSDLPILLVTILSSFYILGTFWLSYSRYGDLWKARLDYPRFSPWRKKNESNTC